MKPIRGCLTVIGAIVVIVVVIVIATSGSSNKVGKTNSPALVTHSGSGGHHKAAPKVAAKPQTFRGDGTQNIGTIAVPVDSVLHWSCPSCGSSNFIVQNSDITTDINVNGLNQKSGKTVVDAGTYHNVTINTEGSQWTIRIVPGS